MALISQFILAILLVYASINKSKICYNLIKFCDNVTLACAADVPTAEIGYSGSGEIDSLAKCGTLCSQTSGCFSFNVISSLCQIFNFLPHNFTLVSSCQHYYLFSYKANMSCKVEVSTYVKPAGSALMAEHCSCPFANLTSLGWTTIQRRCDGTVDFGQNWTAYEKGFGRQDGSFWIGNSWLHTKTASFPSNLRVDLLTFGGVQYRATYSTFQVGSAADKYRLYLSGYSRVSSNVSDSFSGHSDNFFSTSDRDNHVIGTENCAKKYNAGWWYLNCYYCNLNGVYFPSSVNNLAGIVWSGLDYDRVLKCVEIKVK